MPCLSRIRPHFIRNIIFVNVDMLFRRTITSKSLDYNISERKKARLKDEIQSFVENHKYFLVCVTAEVCEKKFQENVISKKLGEPFSSRTSIWQFPWKRDTLICENSENIFAKGYDALEDYVHGATEGFDEKLSAAFAVLERFYNNKEMHEESLGKLNSMKTETTVASLLTTHFLSQLLFIPSNYFVDSKSRHKPSDGCPCGCGTAIQYGATHFGSSHLFYGRADIVLFPSMKDIFWDVESDSAVFHVEEPEESPGVKTLDLNWNPEEELNNEDTEDVCTMENKIQDFSDADINQICKQAISMSLWKHKRRLYNGNHRGGLSMVPVCLINKNIYMVVMYNADHDYLLRMKKKDYLILFKNGRLEFSAIINMWMLIHHNLFCTQPDNDAIETLKGTCGLIPRLGQDTFITVVKTSKFDYDVLPGEEYDPDLSEAKHATRKKRTKKYQEN